LLADILQKAAVKVYLICSRSRSWQPQRRDLGAAPHVEDVDVTFAAWGDRFTVNEFCKVFRKRQGLTSLPS